MRRRTWIFCCWKPIFAPAAEDTKDVSARCDIAIEVRRRLPECKVYLACEDGCLEKLPALDKAVELALIDGYCVGSITPQQMRTWLNEAARGHAPTGEPP